MCPVLLSCDASKILKCFSGGRFTFVDTGAWRMEKIMEWRDETDGGEGGRAREWKGPTYLRDD